MTTTKKTLNEITEQVWEFLHLASESGELPLLEDVEVKRGRHASGWTVKAYTGSHFDGRSAAEAVAVVRAYADLQGAQLEICAPYTSITQESGVAVCVKTHLVLGGIPVEVLAIVDGDEYAASQVHVTGEAAALLIGGER